MSTKELWGGISSFYIFSPGFDASADVVTMLVDEPLNDVRGCV